MLLFWFQLPNSQELEEIYAWNNALKAASGVQAEQKEINSPIVRGLNPIS